QRRLAGARRPHDRHEIARLDVERDAPQHEGLADAGLIKFFNVAQTDHCVTPMVSDSSARLVMMITNHSTKPRAAERESACRWPLIRRAANRANPARYSQLACHRRILKNGLFFALFCNFADRAITFLGIACSLVNTQRRPPISPAKSTPGI